MAVFFPCSNVNAPLVYSQRDWIYLKAHKLEIHLIAFVCFRENEEAMYELHVSPPLVYGISIICSKG